MTTTTNTQVNFFKVARESEKAICLSCLVSYDEDTRTKDLWFPRSVISDIHMSDDANVMSYAMVASWFCTKAESANHIGRYAMRFE